MKPLQRYAVLRGGVVDVRTISTRAVARDNVRQGREYLGLRIGEEKVVRIEIRVVGRG